MFNVAISSVCLSAKRLVESLSPPRWVAQIFRTPQMDETRGRATAGRQLIVFHVFHGGHAEHSSTSPDVSSLSIHLPTYALQNLV